MIFGKTTVELKVGIFVFIGIAILAMFVLFIGDWKAWASGYRFNFIFNFANGVKIGAPVRFSGVDVGEVKEINFIFSPEEQKTKIQIVSTVRKSVKIPADSAVWVNTLGLLGEKYIEIMPGKDYNNCLAKNSTLAGVDPVPMQEITKLATNIARNLNDSIEKIKNKEGTLGKLIYEEAIYNDLEAFAHDIRQHPWKLFIRTKD